MLFLTFFGMANIDHRFQQPKLILFEYLINNILMKRFCLFNPVLNSLDCILKQEVNMPERPPN